MRRLLTFIALSAFVPSCISKTVTYNWDVGWIIAAPDGFSRPVIAINGQWPPPKVEADLGDTISVTVTNSLGNETTGIHWHGQFQEHSNFMDGPPGVTQCPIQPGSSYTYTFTANPAGTYWYHSHAPGQYGDGLRGPLVIHDRRAEKELGFDQELTLVLSDWYHDQMPGLLHYYLGTKNTDGAEPIPMSSLINDKLTETFDILPGKKYMIRVISTSALAAHFVKFDGHNMSVVAVDGVQVVPVVTDTIEVSAGQRMDVIITGLMNATKNYAFVASMDPDMFDSVPDTLNLNSDGVLVYNPKFAAPAPLRQEDYTALDDIGLIPLDGQPILGAPDQTITLAIDFESYSFGQRASLGSEPYISPKVPTIYTALTTGQNALNPAVYGPGVNPFVLRYGQVIELVINNLDTGGHPMHLHGHVFQVLTRTSTQPWDGNTSGFPKIPMKRDTVKVAAGGAIVLRFKAENPGVWLFHCHIDWHVEAGLSVTFIEAPIHLQEQFQHGGPIYAANNCKKQGIPISGNCAGQTRNVTDNSKCNNVIDPNPWGSLINPPSSRKVRGLMRDIAALRV
ncbi:multicopper oxidase [Lepidopterella palustris CBS 459.81]|uniref:Multicopper oxidase n=1 Tax=Lepidopterella palustris CBS 459.81 TaxID=1314670 RepID=A0A8E2JI24_9PEZI|nr:multicopper oxidase [Lepidopterella palustris CBS 459.81]